MKNIQKYIWIVGIAIIVFLFGMYWLIYMKDPYTALDSIRNRDIFEQEEEEYYVYYYKKDCPYCVRIESLIMQLAESEEALYVVNMGKDQNTKSYDWNKMHTEEDKEIGILNLDSSINFYAGESKEKYQNQTEKNQYGKIKRYEIVEADDKYLLENSNARIGYVYASIQTPEIDYEDITDADEIVIAGVPTLLHIKNGKIDGFYFDAPEIAAHLEDIQ